MGAARKKQPDGNRSSDNKHPWSKANPISRLLFWWMNPIISLGNKRALKEVDLYKVVPEDESDVLGSTLEKEWLNQVEKSSDKNRPSFTMTLVKVFGHSYVFPGFLVFLDDCVVKVGQPVCLSQMINYFDPNSEMPVEHAILYATGVVLGAAITAFSNHFACFHSHRLGMQIRVATTSLIFRKSLRLSRKSLTETPIGQMTNIISNDVNRFDQVFMCLHSMWSGPLAIIFTTILLYYVIGLASFCGIVFLLIILVPLQHQIGQMLTRLRKKATLKTDDRIQLINEIIPAMRAIKMYAWEEPFIKLAQTYRKFEMNLIRRISYYRAFNVTISYISAKLMIFPTLIVVVLTGSEFSATTVFLVVSLFNNIRVVINTFTVMIQQAADIRVSVKRIEEFLTLEEIEINKDFQPQLNKNDAVIDFNSVFVKWPVIATGDEKEETTLSDVSFTVRSNKLLTVLGQIGSGKSSLLNVIMGELPILSGTSTIKGKVAYCSQEPWIFTGTVRENIVCGNAFDLKRYHRVIRACALEIDFDQLPQGDASMIGEGEVSLSGGQKARVNLARCLYVEADIYLLDDPLSAVDTRVGSHIFRRAIKEFLQGKIRVLVTHHLKHLDCSDEILVLNSGKVEFFGSFQEFNGEEIGLTKMASHTEDLNGDDQIEDLVLFPLRDFPAMGGDEKSCVKIDQIDAYYTSNRSQYYSFDKIKPKIEEICIIARDQKNRSPEESTSTKQKVTKKTKTTADSVTAVTYWKYFRSGASVISFILFIFNCVFTEVLFCASDYWLNLWTAAEKTRLLLNSNMTAIFDSAKNASFQQLNTNDAVILDTQMGIYVYSILIGSVFIFGYARSLHFHGICTSASEKLHDTMFQSVIRAPIKFFDSNPIGRIVNRFSKDTGSMDDMLPIVLFDPIWIGLNTIGSIVTTCVFKYWLIFPAFVLTIAFYFTRRWYLEAAIGIKRIEVKVKSPVFTQFYSSLIGLTTLRAHHCQAHFQKEFDKYQDNHSAAWFLFIASSRWLSVWMDIFLLIYVAIITYACVAFGKEVGLIISAATSLALFQYGMKQSAEMVNLMTSVDRIIEYGKLSPEAPLHQSDFEAPSNWPCKGRIQFNNTSLSYNPSQFPVLKNIHCTINSCEKIGIVGRSGAGKSTLIAALFRLTEPDGNILIDGIDTKALRLHDLRSKISIIPQEPFLFTGTLRSNLDPFGKMADDILWSAIEDSHLSVVMATECGSTAQSLLDFMVFEGGSNLSAGQRQLISIARAILRNNRILILDEATASIDKETESLIQAIIREKFQNCTVLTIAHRLDTIIQSDKIMVLDFGRLIEFDEPIKLLNSNVSGMFRSLVNQTGPEITKKYIENLAKQDKENKISHLKSPTVADVCVGEIGCPSNFSGNEENSKIGDIIITKL